MKLHFVTSGETPRIREIWELCFDDTKAFNDLYFGKRYDHRNTIAVIQDGQIASTLQMTPYHMNIRGKRLNCGFIVGAATHPDFRNRGLMRFLMNNAFHIMESRGEYISMLYPASYGFYHSFGYEVITSVLQYTLDSRHIQLYAGDYVLEPLNYVHHKAAIKKCYDAYMEGFSGYAARSLADWQFKLGEWKAEGWQGVVCRPTDVKTVGVSGITGYAVFTPDNEKIIVHETAFTDASAFECLINGLSLERAALRVTLSERQRIFDAMPDGRGITTLNPYVMGRILNLKAFMGRLPIMGGESVTLEIQDNLEGNYGVFTLSAGGLKDSFAQPELVMDIRCFTQIAFGYTSAMHALYNGRISGSLVAANRLDKLLPKVDTFCLDMY